MKKRGDRDELGEAMEKLAMKLTNDLNEGKEIKKTASDTFGKLSGYFAATRRLNLKTPDPEDETGSFTDFARKINGTESTPVPVDRRNN